MKGAPPTPTGAGREAGRKSLLNTTEHSRESAGLTYVYPVVSRRAGGLSIGINLNTNNACNWRCIYCQVPNLTRGAAPPVDLGRLEHELRDFLDRVLDGDFLKRRVPDGMRRLNDIAISGNGEPTSAREFEAVIDVIGRVRRAVGMPQEVKTILITNGSLVHRPGVQAGLRALARLNGELWFKVDRATDAGIETVNDVGMSVATMRRNIEESAGLCPTWVQSCFFAIDGEPPPAEEVDAYVGFLADLRRAGVPLRGALLYGIARESMQPEAPRLGPLPAEWFESLAARLRDVGYEVRISV